MVLLKLNYIYNLFKIFIFPKYKLKYLKNKMMI